MNWKLALHQFLIKWSTDQRDGISQAGHLNRVGMGSTNQKDRFRSGCNLNILLATRLIQRRLR